MIELDRCASAIGRSHMMKRFIKFILEQIWVEIKALPAARLE
jgi:hypothetical protein